VSALSPRQIWLLDEACKPINEAFGESGCYHVGTSAEGRSEYRDVDVRYIMHDDQYDKLQEAIGVNGIAFLGLSIGNHLAMMTHLPIDFQIQPMARANELHGDKFRNPLGVRRLSNFQGDCRTGSAYV
jgi:hypothetical protein